MIPSVATAAVIAALSFVLQSTWFQALAIGGAVPDIAMLTLLWVSYRNSKGEGPTASFLAGFVSDFMSSAPLGFNSFIYCFTAWLASLLHGTIRLDRIVLPLLIGFGGTMSKALASNALAFVLGVSRISAHSFSDSRFWIEAILNALLAPPLFMLLERSKRWLVTEERVR